MPLAIGIAIGAEFQQTDELTLLPNFLIEEDSTNFLIEEDTLNILIEE